ncbi:hypothetical protein O7634_22460 [Micromonospora sp. WMMD1120]|uniref:hypothetical protein n=1 Tax=Micromonospora sp. WMMD1120 TaxID=3016106 RepID=UPI002417077A|nr:hypothetical protein [Micromonospora sp. WMMD1120]MDG4809520.1 hypothetical protein [Micromonospora sp. WMMD1120]
MSDAENWCGGFYELLLELGATDDLRLDRAVRSLWRAAGVRECRVGPDLVEVAPGADALAVDGHLRGTVTLPSGDRVVCGGYAHRYDSTDSVELYLPLGALERIDRRIGGYPFNDRGGVESLAWRAPLDRWLADVAIRVYDEVPFERALIGFEVDEDVESGDDPGRAARLLPTTDGWDYRPATT